MKNRISLFILIAFILISCDFRKSVSKNLVTGLTSKGDGLSCEEVYLTVNDQRVDRDYFTYGEIFYLNFENVEGLEEIDDKTFPGLQLVVTSEKGDTVLNHADLYARYSDGINLSPLLAQANITIARPMYSHKNYNLFVKIWDKKGKGTFTATMDFNVVPNDHINVENKGVTYDEIYLFSQDRNTTIVDDNAQFNETIYMVFEGLNGFKSEAGKVYLGLSLKILDANGDVVLNEEDLAGDNGMAIADINSQLAPNFIISNSDVKSPVTCEILVWDKKSDHQIKTSVKLNME